MQFDCSVRRKFTNISEENTMNRNIALGMAMLAGGAIGATAVQGLHAQGYGAGANAAAYAIVDISKMNDADTFKTLFPIAQKAMDDFGGKYLIRTDKITSLDGTPPARFVVIAFASMEKATAWHASVGMKQVDDIRLRSTNSRQFFVEGMAE
jgi:uncharacterized protein (DUF1330 family)